VRHACAASRTEGMGEADGWATTTVSCDGVADEQGPSGSGGGREERSANRRDRPVSGCGWRSGRGLRGARVGTSGKEVGRALMNSRISDLLKSVLNKFKLI
jgi:hypothetical protein